MLHRRSEIGTGSRPSRHCVGHLADDGDCFHAGSLPFSFPKSAARSNAMFESESSQDEKLPASFFVFGLVEYSGGQS